MGSKQPESTIKGACGDADPAPPPLPCLYSHISIENSEHEPNAKEIEFTTGRKRSAYILAESVEKMARIYGLERLGFLTLTFRDHVTEPKEAQKRLNSLFSNVIKPRYGEYLGVLERQKSGRIHYHLLVKLSHDIRTGVDFEAIKKRDYRSAGAYLRSEWKFWRDTARKYRFGRTELLPVMSSSTAIKYYVGKYISKSIAASNEAPNVNDKGVRLVRYSKKARAGNTRFSFLSKGTFKWRDSVAFFASLLSDHYNEPMLSFDDISNKLGPRWAYKYRAYILDISAALDAYYAIDRFLDKGWKDELRKQFNVSLAIKIIGQS